MIALRWLRRTSVGPVSPTAASTSRPRPIPSRSNACQPWAWSRSPSMHRTCCLRCGPGCTGARTRGAPPCAFEEMKAKTNAIKLTLVCPIAPLSHENHTILCSRKVQKNIWCEREKLAYTVVMVFYAVLCDYQARTHSVSCGWWPDVRRIR